MKRTYILDGLDCVNCANKVESVITQISGVCGVTVNFITTKLTFNIVNEDAEKVENLVENAIRRVDSNIILRQVK